MTDLMLINMFVAVTRTTPAPCHHSTHLAIVIQGTTGHSMKQNINLVQKFLDTLWEYIEFENIASFVILKTLKLDASVEP